MLGKAICNKTCKRIGLELNFSIADKSIYHFLPFGTITFDASILILGFKNTILYLPQEFNNKSNFN